jgi:hypothetical protein
LRSYGVQITRDDGVRLVMSQEAIKLVNLLFEHKGIKFTNKGVRIVDELGRRVA